MFKQVLFIGPTNEVPRYRIPEDWQKEVNRCKAYGFKATMLNPAFKVSDRLA